ncbi:hypothetical protein [Caballeronia novacaledonica]|uniref:hypothetical protein n=1 Tax=Caballeronia novacaledonica TaxID=1544861 RepID=UPI001EDEEF38|nr:hypothetical protein [Caballeronia novacaledonica]
MRFDLTFQFLRPTAFDFIHAVDAIPRIGANTTIVNPAAREGPCGNASADFYQQTLHKTAGKTRTYPGNKGLVHWARHFGATKQTPLNRSLER